MRRGLRPFSFFSHQHMNAPFMDITHIFQHKGYVMKPYHCLVTKNKEAIIRSMDDGISEHEWNEGVRMMASKAISRTLLEQEARDKGYKVLDASDWKELFKQEIREFYRSTYIPYDKWDTKPTIY